MAIGGWQWWLDHWASLDRDDRLIAVPSDLFFTLKTSDGSAFHFTLTKSGDQLESSLAKWEGQPSRPASQSVGGGRMDRYRQMATEQLGKAADRILGESLGTDLLSDSPAVEELARVMAAGRFGSLYGTAAPGPVVSAQVATSGQAPTSGQVLTSGGEDPGYPNRAPVAEDDDFIYLGHNNPNQHVVFFEGPDGVLTNDFDEDGDDIWPLLATPPGYVVDPAAFAVNSDGSFSYEPIDNWDGVDWFSYRVTDGVWDHVDEDGVIPSDPSKGRNEVDLMKLVIDKPIPDQGGDVSLKSDDYGTIRFWEDENKVQELVVDENGEALIATSDLPRTVWVEVTAPSSGDTIRNSLSSELPRVARHAGASTRPTVYNLPARVSCQDNLQISGHTRGRRLIVRQPCCWSIRVSKYGRP